MADYWKSQAKKFCDFCKCWIADNKPSVEFHEKGKRHKENVEKRIKEMTKQSCKDYKNTMKVEDQMKQMEEAAMKAYMKDVEENRDYTSHLIKEELIKKDELARERNNAACSIEKIDNASCSTDIASKEVETPVQKEDKVLWQETQSEEGHSYYWNVETGEALWEAPTEGFVSIAEQKKIAEKKKAIEELKLKEEEEAKAIEERAREAREKMRKKKVKKEQKNVTPIEPLVMGPAPRKDPYGMWKTVETQSLEPVDYQLPQAKQAVEYVRLPTVNITEPKIKFKEKTMTSLNSESVEGGQTDFKKRKMNSTSKRNTRQRVDDD